jgi:hypothetical protein
MALKGTLRDFSLADIFQLIGIQKKTGVLTLKSDKEVVTVSFVAGSVVAADSLHRRLEDRLGTVLVKSGRITEAQLQDALRIQKNTLKRMGNILVENGFIDKEGLKDALHIQISQMVYRLFRWRDGEYNFSQEERVDYDQEHVTPMSAESILMEGARILDEWPMIEKGIKSFSTVFRHAAVEIAPASGGGEPAAGEEPARGVTLNDQERLIHALADGRRTVQEIVERSTFSEFDTCRILYDLINRQLLEEVRSSAQKAAAPAPAPPLAVPRELSPAALGVAYLVLILAAGGILLHRARPTISGWGRGELLGAWLAPLVPESDVETIKGAISRSRLARVDFALQVYYLLNRGYPQDLHLLVTWHLMRPEGITDPWGTPYLYDVQTGGYRLAVALGPGAKDRLEIRSSPPAAAD